jgi:hypothetical protein
MWWHCVARRAAVVGLLTMIGVVALAAMPVQSAHADASETCVHAPTIQSLHDCVEMMAHQGVIDNQGTATSLLAKIDSAQEAVKRDQAGVAISILQALTAEVSAQAGRHIAEPHAEHLILHAKLVIQELESSGTA